MFLTSRRPFAIGQLIAVLSQRVHCFSVETRAGSLSMIAGDASTEEAKLLGPQFQPLKRRWLILMLYCVSVLTCGVFQFTYASFQAIALDYYKVGTFELNLMVNSYYALYVPFTFLSAWVVSSKSLYASVIIGALCNVLGGWLRYVGALAFTGNFWVALLGQSIGAVGQPFMGMNTVTLLAVNWFPEKERTIATTIASLFNIIGAGVIYGVGPVVVSTAADIPTLVIGQAIAATVLGVATVTLFRSRPPLPPSAAADAGEKKEEESFMTSLKQLFTNRNYILLTIGFSLGFGVFQSFTGLMNQIVAPLGYDNDAGGYFGLALIGAGILGALIAGVLVDVTGRYIPILLPAVLLCLGCLLSFPFVIIPNQFALVCALIGLSGFATLAAVPVLMELAAEVTFPISEGVSAGFMNLFGNGLGLVCTVALDRIQQAYGAKNALWFLFAVWCVVVTPVFFLRPKLLRKEHEASVKSAVSVSDPINASLHV